MTPDQASAQPSTESTATTASSATRPSGRGRHSRGRRRPRRSTDRPRRLSEPVQEGSAATATQPVETREALSPPFQPAKVDSIQAAIETVTTIITELRNVLNDMELVLEYLEDADRQQITDQREIESLQQRLNMIHRRMDRHQPARGSSRLSEDEAEAAD